MTDAYKAGREAGIREAAEVAAYEADFVPVRSDDFRRAILALLDTPSPAGVRVPDELYQAAKRDAEEAEAYAAELEAKLANAVEALDLADAALSGANMNMRVVEKKVKAAIAELKGEKDE